MNSEDCHYDCHHDEDGFMPPSECYRCTTPLQGQYSGHPAESYAGTFTGLCGKCTHAEPIKIGEYDNGAELWEYAPHCPSWRRDRETYIAFSDCLRCIGRGFSWIGRSDASGGSYRAYCRECNGRFHKSEALYSIEVGKYETLKKELEDMLRVKHPKPKTDEQWADLHNSPLSIQFSIKLRKLWAMPTPKVPEPPKLIRKRVWKSGKSVLVACT